MRLIGTKGRSGYRRMKEGIEREKETLLKIKERNTRIVFKAPSAVNITFHISETGSINCSASVAVGLKCPTRI
jgi:hypothetical protein